MRARSGVYAESRKRTERAFEAERQRTAEEAERRKGEGK